ncbi:MAG: hypothetical protein K5745_03200 [Saccharofermentans sp.]|nr:hypothetical protein [Saccharofermentans sp.]
MKLVKFEKEERCIKDFIKLAVKLYRADENMEDPDSIRKILMGEHPLSKYYSLAKFLVYDDEDNVRARFCITSYEGDDTAYLGFFECVEDEKTAKFLFDSAYEYCRANGFARITGPVDASFWIKYRLKINKFGRPYTGEPYNKDYYLKLFTDNGFEVKEHYTSHAFRSVGEEYRNPKFEEHYKEFTDAGYEIRSPKEEEFAEAIEDVYRLVTDLYSDFPIFKDVERDSFMEVFMSYKQIMNMSMTKLAYYKGKAVGFYVSIPDYGNLVYHTNNPVNIAKILMTRKKPKRYVMLYMGADRQHRGLGKALVYAVMKELMASGLPSIGALIRDGKLTQSYATGDITDVFEYVLLERTVN